MGQGSISGNREKWMDLKDILKSNPCDLSMGWIEEEKMAEGGENTVSRFLVGMKDRLEKKIKSLVLDMLGFFFGSTKFELRASCL
jgi:hypothetical protein